ncbi:hypothetical protein JZQ99_000159 [Salmonella enterica subsp. houtenae serovar 43:z4,z23:-]|nr:hypothetical protein [Salmonella enterica subsp. houtenae serovar Houten]
MAAQFGTKKAALIAGLQLLKAHIPLFDQIFNTPSLYEEPLAITNDPFDYTALTGDDGRIVKQICAGLGIDRAQFVLLAQQVSKAQGDGSTSLNCSLDVVSAFYRLVMISLSELGK